MKSKFMFVFVICPLNSNEIWGRSILEGTMKYYDKIKLHLKKVFFFLKSLPIYRKNLSVKLIYYTPYACTFIITICYMSSNERVLNSICLFIHLFYIVLLAVLYDGHFQLKTKSIYIYVHNKVKRIKI